MFHVCCVANYGELYTFNYVLKQFIEQYDAEVPPPGVKSNLKVLFDMFAVDCYDSFEQFRDSFTDFNGPLTMGHIAAWHQQTGLELVFVGAAGQRLCLSQLLESLHFEYPKGCKLTTNELMFFNPAKVSMKCRELRPEAFGLLLPKQLTSLVQRFYESKFTMALYKSTLADLGYSLDDAPKLTSFLKKLDDAKVHADFFHIILWDIQIKCLYIFQRAGAWRRGRS